jgi:hypothetical protein
MIRIGFEKESPQGGHNLGGRPKLCLFIHDNMWYFVSIIKL